MDILVEILVNTENAVISYTVYHVWEIGACDAVLR